MVDNEDRYGRASSSASSVTLASGTTNIGLAAGRDTLDDEYNL